jgi:hypothetical protein
MVAQLQPEECYRLPLDPITPRALLVQDSAGTSPVGAMVQKMNLRIEDPVPSQTDGI